MDDRQPGVRPTAFFATTFLLSWAIWVPLMLVRLDVLPPVVPDASLTAVALLGVLMPAVAASVLTARAGGRHALRELWARLTVWRVGWWWLAALGIQPVVLLLSAVAFGVLQPDYDLAAVAGLTLGSVLTQVLFLLVASTGEEVGWRGLALPGLQAHRGPLVASIVLGLVTATWHLPYWVLQGVPEDHGWGYLVLDYVFILALTFQLTWLVNHARGSVLVAVAFHVVFNTVNVALLPVTASDGAFAVLTALECVITLALVRHLGPAVQPAAEPAAEPAAATR